MYSTNQNPNQQSHDYGRPLGGGDDEDNRMSRYSDSSRPASYETNPHLAAPQHQHNPSSHSSSQEDDRHSTESSENSTKVGSIPMSPAASAYRQTPYGDAYYKDHSGPPSDHSHDPNGYYNQMYQSPGLANSGYDYPGSPHGQSRWSFFSSFSPYV